MSCVLDNGFALGCNVSGGVKNVYIGTYDPDVTYTETTPGIIDALNDNPNAVDAYNFEQDIEFAGLEQTGQYSRENGSVFYESVLSVKFIHLDAALRNLIQALGKAPIFAVVESNAGEFYLLGEDSPGRATEGTASLGVAFGDMNGATLSFTFKSEDPAKLASDLLNFDSGTPDATKITIQATT